MNEDELEQKLRDAVVAETEPVRVDEYASLTSIRQRAAAARRRRLVGATALGAAAALLIGIGIGAAVGSDDDDHSNVAANGPSTTIGADCASTTTGPSTTDQTTTAPQASAPLTTEPLTTMTDVVVVHPGDGCADEVPTTTEPPTTPSTGTVVTTGTTTPAASPVVFPFSGSAQQSEDTLDPETTAAAFLEAIGADNPALGAFQQTGPETGTIDVHPRDGNGQVRTDFTRSVLHMVRMSGHWAVLRASSDAIVIDSAAVRPPADAKGHWTLEVRGRGRGFEGVLHLHVVGHDVAFDTTTTAMASGDMELRPFTSFIDLGTTPAQVLTLVVANESGETGGPGDLAAVAVQTP